MAADDEYYSLGELANFIYCLLHKFMKASSLPLVELWEEYVTPNHSRFPAIDENYFLSGTRLMTALDKVGSQYSRTEFHCYACRFVEEFAN